MWTKWLESQAYVSKALIYKGGHSGQTIYCIIGDGGAREGQIWEAMDFIADMRLTNVVAIFNCNTLGQSDFVAKPEDWRHLQRKAEAFGWRTVVIGSVVWHPKLVS